MPAAVCVAVPPFGAAVVVVDVDVVADDVVILVNVALTVLPWFWIIVMLTFGLTGRAELDHIHNRPGFNAPNQKLL